MLFCNRPAQKQASTYIFNTFGNSRFLKEVALEKMEKFRLTHSIAVAVLCVIMQDILNVGRPTSHIGNNNGAVVYPGDLLASPVPLKVAGKFWDSLDPFEKEKLKSEPGKSS